jgi:hypothetical protein
MHLTPRQLNRATLARQMLLEREKVAAADAVERLCAMQAQEPRHPFVGLWTRVEGFRRAELRDALLEREVVRATSLRGTLHLMSAADYLTFRGVLAPMLNAAVKVLGDRAKGLDPERLLPVARKFLAAGPLTFEELRPLLAAEFPGLSDRALGYAVRTQLPLVMVPTADRWSFPAVADFTPADDWLGAPPSTDEAPDELVLRYLAAFGPATTADVQTWCGLRGLRPVLKRLRPQLVTFRDERKRELFDLPDAPRPDPDIPAPPRFLPDFDNLLLAHADRTRIIADEHRPHVFTKNLRVRATFLWDGQVAGVWASTRKRGAGVLRISPFAPLPRGAADALAAEGEALLLFLEDDLDSVEVTVDAPAA